MRNQQPPERSKYLEGGEFLEVHSKWNTIQGEGPYAGSPASFIRLAGCNLQCPLCDTEYTKTRVMTPATELAAWVKAQPYNIVVLTGGEPFRQDLLKFADILKYDLGKTLQIETNGTVIPDNFHPKYGAVVCSPKNDHLSPQTRSVVSAWKYVLRHDAVDELDGLPTSALGMQARPGRPTNTAQIYLQPCDDKDPEINRLNLEATVKSCMNFGYSLCLQVQKIINMP